MKSNRDLYESALKVFTVLRDDGLNPKEILCSLEAMIPTFIDALAISKKDKLMIMQQSIKNLQEMYEQMKTNQL